jgi:hypothetical protein
MSKLLEKLTQFFKMNSYTSNLEAFVASKNPASAAEVEFWCRHYDQHNYVRGL